MAFTITHEDVIEMKVRMRGPVHIKVFDCDDATSEEELFPARAGYRIGLVAADIQMDAEESDVHFHSYDAAGPTTTTLKRHQLTLMTPIDQALGDTLLPVVTKIGEALTFSSTKAIEAGVVAAVYFKTLYDFKA